MALTSYLIAQASDHLDEKIAQLWLLLFRKLKKYQEYSFVYSPLVEERLQAAEGTIKARMLNALMAQIDELGVGEVAIKGDREGTHWNQTEERMALIQEGLDVLFDDIQTLVTPSGTTASGVYNRRFATGNRSVPSVCPRCNAPFNHGLDSDICMCGG